MDFISFYTQTQHTTGTGHFTYCDMKDGSLVTETNIVTKLIGWFGNVWPACTRDLTSPLRKTFFFQV